MSSKTPITQYDLLKTFMAKFKVFVDGLAIRVPSTPQFQMMISRFQSMATRPPEELAVLAKRELAPHANNIMGLVKGTAAHFGVSLEQVKPEDVAKLVAYFDALCKIVSA